MGKGNKHRGGNRRDEDRGDDKRFAQERSFGGNGSTRKFSGTLGAALGQSGDHSPEHSAAMEEARKLRQSVEFQERTLSKNPEIAAYFKLRGEFYALERKFNAMPDFAKYQKDRRSIRPATLKADAMRSSCKKCGFVAQSSRPAPAPVAAVQAPVAPEQPEAVAPQVSADQPVAQTQTA